VTRLDGGLSNAVCVFFHDLSHLHICACDVPGLCGVGVPCLAYDPGLSLCPILSCNSGHDPALCFGAHFDHHHVRPYVPVPDYFGDDHPGADDLHGQNLTLWLARNSQDAVRLAHSPYYYSIQACRGRGPKLLGLRLIRAVLGVATKEIQRNLVDVMEGTSLGA